MNCEKRCDKKYNPKKAKKINAYVARELWECKMKCNSKKTSKGSRKKQQKRRSGSVKRKKSGKRKKSKRSKK